MKKKEDSELLALYEEYASTRSLEVWRKIYDANLTYVTKIAKRIRRTLFLNISLKDLISEGMRGLSEALEDFDPALGVSFKTYCSKRVKGQIIDFAHALNWASKTYRQYDKRYADAEKAFGKGDTILTAEEVVDCLNVKPAKARCIIRGALLVRRHPSMTNMTDLEEEIDLRDPKAVRPERVIFDKATFFELLEGLSTREIIVCALLFLDESGATQRTIAESLGVCRSAISLNLSSAKKKIKERLVQEGFFTPEGVRIED